jgi:hypothetical protein
MRSPCPVRRAVPAAMHAGAPFVLTFDDHEVDNDYAGDVPQDPPQAAFRKERDPRRAATTRTGSLVRPRRAARGRDSSPSQPLLSTSSGRSPTVP